MDTYTDAYLTHWADIFVAQKIARYMTLEQFLVAPAITIERIESGRYQPLLRAQRDIAQKVLDAEHIVQRAANGMTTTDDAEELERIIECARGIVDVPRRDGRAIEALHHHRHKRSRSAFYPAARQEV